jgi:hypothetical protein
MTEREAGIVGPLEMLAALQSARREHDKQRTAVTDWMNAEGADGRFVQNQSAPAWPEYVAAVEALAALRERYGT